LNFGKVEPLLREDEVKMGEYLRQGLSEAGFVVDLAVMACPKLFDRSSRIDPSRQRHGSGAGLGLAIVKSIIDAHGGNIDVVSGAGRTRFQISLPGPSTTVTDGGDE
jgi:signal transduction histidine kinase